MGTANRADLFLRLKPCLPGGPAQGIGERGWKSTPVRRERGGVRERQGGGEDDKCREKR